MPTNKKEFNEKEYYEKYAGEITCAYISDIRLNEKGKEVCQAKRSKEREKYILRELTDDVVLIECPKDMLAIEFETHDSTGKKHITKDKIKEFVKETAKRCKRFKLDYCVCSHGGTSDYVYICNIENLIEGREKECKKELAKKIIPKDAIDFLDLSNLGKTLIPIINRPHWKRSKYNGEIHKIIDGTNPDRQNNKLPDVIIQKTIYENRPEVKKENYEYEEDINSIQLTDIISTSSLKRRGNEYQGSNPWHGSDSGTNFTVNTLKNVWHCFRCNVGGSSAQAIALNRGIISSCDEKLGSEKFKQVLNIAQNEYGLKIKKEKDTKEKIQEKILNFIDKSDLAEKIWEVQPYFYDKSGCFWLWRNDLFKWERVDDVEILNMVSSKSYANTVKSNEKQEIIEAMKQYGRLKKPKEIGKRWIQFRDTIYDLETDEEFKATPKYLITNPIPWELGKTGETPTIDRIFEEWVGKNNVQTLYEIIAYCMLPDYPLHRIFCFVGSGLNGKGKFLELLRNFIGNENCCSTELDTLLNSRFEVTRLNKKLVCQMGETNFNEMSKTSMLKKLSGGDLIGFEIKGKTPFEGLNYAKIIIATNSLPSTTDKTIGFYRRWLIVDFPYQFSEKKDILSDIPEEEMNALAFKCLGYLRLLLEKREFHNEGSIEDRMQKYEERSNPIEKFVEEYCDTSDPEVYITKSQFSKRLSEWLKSNGYRSLSDVEITKRMKKMGFEEDRKYINWYYGEKFDKIRARVWLGIKFNSDKWDK